jgi:hypothetical protein
MAPSEVDEKDENNQHGFFLSNMLADNLWELVFH